MVKALRYIFFAWCFVFAALTSFCQPGTSVDLKKPPQYEKRTLGAEKTGQKKFNYPRRLYQNTITHYNYYFNGNAKLNEIVELATQANPEDYTALLPFYKYNLDMIAGNGELDSIIYKCNEGLLLHDLRNYWVDDIYLLLGKTYYYKKDFDSADQVFRYVAYAFAPKEEGGYDIPVGSNVSGTAGLFSVATKENNSIVQKVFSTPPSRNDALLWQARNYIETDRLGEAAGILEILGNDPVFPARLSPELHELLSWLYYKQNLFDSSASHLVRALDRANTKQDKARMEFLAGQMFQASGMKTEAIAWYTKAASITIDPVLGVYANLNSIIAAGDSSGESLIQQKLDNLMKMAKRDKYVSSRDIIYYAVAQIYVEQKDYKSATQMLKKSIQYNEQENPAQRSRSFMLLADIKYETHEYVDAKNYYDSVSANYLVSDKDKQRLDERSPGLSTIATNFTTIHDEDSLQNVAGMPEDKREAYVKKVLKTLRKQQGLKDDENDLNVNPAIRQENPGDLFNQGNTAAKTSDWYFNNLTLKSTGFNQFRAKWGQRPNVDDWRRLDAVRNAEQKEQQDQQAEDDSTGGAPNNNAMLPQRGGMGKSPGVNPNAANGADVGELSYDALYANLPITDEQKKASDEKIAEAMFSNGQAFQDQLEDYEAAIKAYEELLTKFPDNKNREQAFFNLYYCYTKTGRREAADSAVMALKRDFPKGEYTTKLNNKGAVAKKEADPATKKYEDIYNLFIEGSFDKAKTEKEAADKEYGNSYWTPQLLYIESIYYVSKKDDSTAIEKLTNLQQLFAKSPMAEKAATMIDVLKRRNEIEDYLTNLKIERYKEDAAPVIDLTPVRPTIEKATTKTDSVVAKPVTEIAKTKVDTTGRANDIVKTYEFDAKDPQYAVILLDKVDQVFINETKNAFSRYNAVNFYSQKLFINPLKLDDRYSLVLIGPFDDAVGAMNYIDKTKPVASSRIIPWLKPDKYSFAIISEANLDIMRETKDVDSYKRLLEKALPGKF